MEIMYGKNETLHVVLFESVVVRSPVNLINLITLHV
jgi:hypothetical protein